MKRSAFDDLIERGVTAHQAGRYDAALSAYRSALNLRANDSEALSLYGLALVHTGSYDAAEIALRKAVEHEPDQVGFRLNLAELFEKTRRYERAMEQLDVVVARSPKLPRGWEKQGDLKALLGQHEAARTAYARALGLDPSNFSTALKLTRVCISLRDNAGAQQALKVVAQLRPNHDAAQRLQIEVLTTSRDWAALEALSRTWLAANPHHTVAWRSLSHALFEQGRNRESMQAYAQSLQNGAQDVDTLTRYSRLCIHAHAFGAATAALNAAENLDAQFAEMLAAKGLLLTYFGRLEDAERYCRRCLETNPEFVPAYTQLSRLTRGRLSDREMDVVARLSKNGQIPIEHRISAAFALADGYDAGGKSEYAFAGYQFANSLCGEMARANGVSYDAHGSQLRTESIKTLFSARGATLAARQDRPRPIFIVGMPRSGTTLIESVLAAHSLVVAGGEQTMMPAILNAYLNLVEADRSREPTRELMDEWAAAYHRENSIVVGATHVTDKHPLNFEAVGLILRLFPTAVIIHVRRNPIETGLSVFRHEFSRFWTFANRLEDIGHFYGQYAQLVAHWEHVFPQQFITVQYEEFAAHFERAAPALVAACGLLWENACLNFQSTDRAIATLSAVQARGPVVAQIGRAGRYGQHLAPLVEALKSAKVDLETGELIGDEDRMPKRQGMSRLDAWLPWRSNNR